MIYRIKWVAFVVVWLAAAASAQVVLENTGALGKIDVEEHLGDTIPLDLSFTDETGAPVKLGDFFHEGRPVVLVLGYYECPMLCNLVFNGLVDGVRQLDWRPGEQFRVVTVSIDPSETPQLAQAKKTNYLAALGEGITDSAWKFMVGKDDQIKALADAVGFKYFHDAARDEYAHPAVVFLLTQDGVVSRYLYGIEFNRSDLKLGLLEASEGKLGTTIDRLILYCFHYDPDEESYVVAAGNVMKLGGGVTLLGLGTLLALLWLSDRRRSRLRTAGAAGR